VSERVKRHRKQRGRSLARAVAPFFGAALFIGMIVGPPAELAAQVPAPVVPAPAAELQLDILQRALGQGLEALFAPEAARRKAQDDAAAAKAQADAQAAQQKQQIRQIEQMLQPAVRTELEIIRQACGDLPSAVRTRLREAAQQASAQVAQEWVGRQGRPTGGTFDARVILHQRIAAAVEAAVEPEAVAAYRRDSAAREARREEAARIRIVAKVDEHLDLTDTQREAILADLRQRWQASWIRELFDNGGVVVNGQRPAPDYAAVCITPHLDPKQREAWTAWARAASGRQVNIAQGMRFDGQGLQQDDEWWKR
jgi:ribosomal protein L9